MITQGRSSCPCPSLTSSRDSAVLAGEGGLHIMKNLIDEDGQQLAGTRCRHDRAGSEKGYVTLGGK